MSATLTSSSSVRLAHTLYDSATASPPRLGHSRRSCEGERPSPLPLAPDPYWRRGRRAGPCWAKERCCCYSPDEFSTPISHRTCLSYSPHELSVVRLDGLSFATINRLIYPVSRLRRLQPSIVYLVNRLMQWHVIRWFWLRDMGLLNVRAWNMNFGTMVPLKLLLLLKIFKYRTKWACSQLQQSMAMQMQSDILLLTPSVLGQCNDILAYACPEIGRCNGCLVEKVAKNLLHWKTWPLLQTRFSITEFFFPLLPLLPFFFFFEILFISFLSFLL